MLFSDMMTVETAPIAERVGQAKFDPIVLQNSRPVVAKLREARRVDDSPAWYEFEEPFILDSHKFETAFGDIATPLPEAMKQTVEWYRRNQA